MRILFFGIPDMAITCLTALVRNKFNVVAAVPPAFGHPCHDLMKKTAESVGVKTLCFDKTLADSNFIEKIVELKPDIGVVCSFDRKLPSELLQIPKFGFINCHPSLLPVYRGGNPYFHVVANNEKETGVTIHFMDENFDTGDIILQEKVPVAPNETAGTIFYTLTHKGADMLVSVLRLIESNKPVPRIPQDMTGNFKKAPSVSVEKGENVIDWNRPVQDIERFVRACNPVYGAATEFRGCSMRIWSARFSQETYGNALPGTITYVEQNGIGIATGKGTLFPIAMQIGFFIITDVFDFIARLQPRKGERFS